MAAKDIELALKKQRLQLQAASQRIAIGEALQAVAPLFSAADRMRSGWQWVKAHPHWLAGAGVALLVARPRAFFRWARRGFFLWRGLHKVQRSAEAFLFTR